MPPSNEPVALEVLSSLSATIPPRELASARGLLITRTHRAALGFGIQTGTAVALRRLDGDGSERQEPTSSTSSSSSPSSPWSAPLVFAVRRASFGVSYGYATVDSVLLLKTDEEARLLAAGAPAFGTEHRFVSSVLDEDENDNDSVEVEVEGCSGLDEEVIRSGLSDAAAAAGAGAVAGTAGTAASASGEAAAEAEAATAATTTPALPAARSAVLFSRSSGALVDMSVVAGMLSLDSAAHEALYCCHPEAPSSSSSSASTAAAAAAAAAASSAATTAAASAPPPPPEPEDVLAGKVARPAAFASVYELLEKMERQPGQQQQQQRGRGS